MDINFRGPERSFPYVSARDVFQAGTCNEAKCRNLASVQKLKDAIVLIGISAVALGDITATPFESTMPGVEVHATILDNP